MADKGFVTIAGAGPLDGSLVSLAVHRKIGQSDVILYDRLIDHEILSWAKQGAVLIDVGKRAKDSEARNREQENIHKLMLKYFKEGKQILRLKGGDPVFFGRLADECEFLTANDVPYEIIPGISSFSAASALAGIPLTHRDHSSSVAIATGHLKSGTSIRSLKIPRADTIVFLMAVKNLSKLVEKMLSEGFFPLTPCALVQNAASPDQKVYVSHLSEICLVKDRNKIGPPALFIVGSVVKYHEKYFSINNRPLFGKTVIWTGSRRDETFFALKDMGLKVHFCPMIEIFPVDAPEFLFQAPLKDIYTDIIFTSRNSVECFIQAVQKSGKDVRQLFNVRILSVGPSTQKALENFGLKADKLARHYDQEGLLEILEPDLSGRSFLFPCAKDARKDLQIEIQKRGAKFHPVIFYETRLPEHAAIPEGKIDGIIFMSPSAVKNLCQLTDPYPGVTAFALGAQTERALKEKGFKDIMVAGESYGKALAKLIQNHWSRGVAARDRRIAQ